MLDTRLFLVAAAFAVACGPAVPSTGGAKTPANASRAGRHAKRKLRLKVHLADGKPLARATVLVRCGDRTQRARTDGAGVALLDRPAAGQSCDLIAGGRRVPLSAKASTVMLPTLWRAFVRWRSGGGGGASMLDDHWPHPLRQAGLRLTLRGGRLQVARGSSSSTLLGPQLVAGSSYIVNAQGKVQAYRGTNLVTAADTSPRELHDAHRRLLDGLWVHARSQQRLLRTTSRRKKVPPSAGSTSVDFDAFDRAARAVRAAIKARSKARREARSYSRARLRVKQAQRELTAAIARLQKLVTTHGSAATGAPPSQARALRAVLAVAALTLLDVAAVEMVDKGRRLVAAARKRQLAAKARRKAKKKRKRKRRKGGPRVFIRYDTPPSKPRAPISVGDAVALEQLLRDEAKKLAPQADAIKAYGFRPATAAALAIKGSVLSYAARTIAAGYVSAIVPASIRHFGRPGVATYRRAITKKVASAARALSTKAVWAFARSIALSDELSDLLIAKVKRARVAAEAHLGAALGVVLFVDRMSQRPWRPVSPRASVTRRGVLRIALRSSRGFEQLSARLGPRTVIVASPCAAITRRWREQLAALVTKHASSKLRAGIAAIDACAKRRGEAGLWLASQRLVRGLGVTPPAIAVVDDKGAVLWRKRIIGADPSVAAAAYLRKSWRPFASASAADTKQRRTAALALAKKNLGGTSATVARWRTDFGDLAAAVFARRLVTAAGHSERERSIAVDEALQGRRKRPR